MTPRVLVVGDAFLDVDVSGAADRLSPDGPVPVVTQAHTTRRGGGAALTAVLAQRAGAQVTLATALAPDRAGDEVRRWTTRHGVEVVDLAQGEGVTGIKTRIRVDRTTVTRVDRAATPPELQVVGSLDRVGGGADVVLASDYGLGLLRHPLLRKALQGTAPVVWDPHPRGAPPLPGARVLTPNLAELAAMTADEGSPSGRSPMARRIDAARRLRASTGAGAVALTCGDEGALVVEEGIPPLAVTGHPVVGDACGAGDCFAGELAVCLGSGLLLSDAVVRAVHRAGELVALGGVAALEATPGGGRSGEDAESVVRRVRAAGGVVVATGGCFDLIHVGHVELIRAAARLGDCLVVLLNSDRSVTDLKGPGRPVVGQEDRASVLRAMSDVDAVVVFDEPTPVETLRRLRPDVFVKGGDYHSPLSIPERATVAEWGGEVVVVPYVSGRSTSRLIEHSAQGATG